MLPASRPFAGSQVRPAPRAGPRSTHLLATALACDSPIFSRCLSSKRSVSAAKLRGQRSTP
jgi:hypothetical protein